MTLAELAAAVPAAARAWVERGGDPGADFLVFHGGSSVDARTGTDVWTWWPRSATPLGLGLWHGPSVRR